MMKIINYACGVNPNGVAACYRRKNPELYYMTSLDHHREAKVAGFTVSLFQSTIFTVYYDK